MKKIRWSLVASLLVACADEEPSEAEISAAPTETAPVTPPDARSGTDKKVRGQYPVPSAPEDPPDPDQPMPSGDVFEHGSGEPMLVNAEWDAVPSATSESAAEDGILTLYVRNQSEVTLDLKGYLILDAGTTDTTFSDIEMESLEPGAELQFDLLPQSYGVDLASMPYSGQALVVVSARPQSSEGPWQSLTTEELYYHPVESGGLLAYGRDALRFQHAAGDFRGQLPVEDGDAESQGRLRVLGEP